MISNPIISVWLCFLICVSLICIILFDFDNKKIILKNVFHNFLNNWTKIVIIILLFIANFRFMILSGSEKIATSNLDILFVIDTTISMDANDTLSTRLNSAKSDIKDIVSKLPGSRFAIITFNNSARVLAPYTRDSSFIYESIDVLKTINVDYAMGSTLNTPIEQIKEYYEINKKEGKKCIIFFISDGEITDDSKLQSYSSIRNYIDGGAVLGYGTSEGGNIFITDEIGNKSQLTYNSSTAISKIDEDNLKSIANDLGVPYIHMTDSTNIDSNIKAISNMSAITSNTIDKTNYDDIYYIFIFLLIPFLLLDIRKYRRIVV